MEVSMFKSILAAALLCLAAHSALGANPTIKLTSVSTTARETLSNFIISADVLDTPYQLVLSHLKVTYQSSAKGTVNLAVIALSSFGSDVAAAICRQFGASDIYHTYYADSDNSSGNPLDHVFMAVTYQDQNSNDKSEKLGFVYTERRNGYPFSQLVCNK
jgi:hypothetical protein